MRSSIPCVVVAAVGLLGVFAPIAGCATDPAADQNVDEGTLEIPLQVQGPGPSNATYRLSATFELSGPGGTQTIHATGDMTSVSQTLPPGFVQIHMLDGWTLDKSDDGETFEPVPALLGIANPVTVRILANHASTLTIPFLIRTASSDLMITFGVITAPREFAGGLTAASGTGDYAAYSFRRMDYAIYYEDGGSTAEVLPDGTMQRTFFSGALAMEVFNDPIGPLANAMAPAMAGGFLQLTIGAKPDGTQVVSGTLDSGGEPFSTWTFGPEPSFFNMPLDASGFPAENTPLFAPSIPFTLETFFLSSDAVLTGTINLRLLIP